MVDKSHSRFISGTSWSNKSSGESNVNVDYGEKNGGQDWLEISFGGTEDKQTEWLTLFPRIENSITLESDSPRHWETGVNEAVNSRRVAGSMFAY